MINETVPFGQWLKQHRRKLDLTQEELSERIGCSYIAIRKIEAGVRRPSRQVAELLADLFKVPAEERAAFMVYARGRQEGGARGEDGESAGGEQARQSSGASGGAASEQPRTSNIPARLTRLIGREEIATEIGSRLLRDEIRLLTLTGAPGIGKTSLALQVAAGLVPHFREGLFFVALAPIVEPAMVTTAIAKVFGLADSGQRPLGEALVALLRDKEMILLLDNFEQVIEAAPLVVDILERCSQVKVLVTSREPLHVRGERVFRVPPLQLPDLGRARTVETLSRSPAVALFVERAHAIEPDFELTGQNAEAVAAICVRLEGLPLAIELAAARIRTLTPQEIQARLESRLKLLSGGPRDLPARQQTLRNAIGWSYALLSDGERKLFARLGVFVGSFDLPAVEAVCNARGDLPFDVLDGLESLRNKSLLKQGDRMGGHSRFTMLEMIREYALERLGIGETSEDAVEGTEGKGEGPRVGGAEIIRRLHAEYFLVLAEGAEMQLRGPQQVDWLYRLEEEHDNLRAALRWSLERRELELALAMAGSLWKFWELHSHLSEGRKWLTAALSLPDSGRITRAKMAGRAKALFAAGRLAERQGDNSSSQPLLEESLALARKIDDKPLLALVLHNLSNLAAYHGDYATGHTLAEESLAIRSEMGDRWGMANVLHNLGFQAGAMGDYAASRAFYEQSLDISRELDDKWGIAYSLDGLGLRILDQRDYALAYSLIQEGLTLRRELDDKSGIARSLERLARIAGRGGQPVRAARLFGAAEALRQKEDIPIMPVDYPTYEKTVVEAHTQLDEAEWAKAWQEGQAMTVEDAVEYALMEWQP
jgi:predicted ATPase/DNA-binding XRE family transcriptional regulator